MPRTKAAPKEEVTPAKRKTRAKPKTTTKVKTTAVRAKSAAKKKVSKPASVIDFDDAQIGDLLALVGKIIDSRRHKQGGVKSLHGIDKILDKYNQHYLHPLEKLEAIVNYGIEKEDMSAHPHFFVVVEMRNKIESDLYKVLAGIGGGKVTFDDAKSKLLAIAAR